MKIALIQLSIEWEDKVANMLKTETLLREASERGCDVAVLPEMFSTGFSMNVSGMAESEEGITAQFLGRIAKQYSINVIAGFPARGNKGMGRNVAHVYGRDGALIASYSKMHPFCYAGEHEHYEAGDAAVVFDLEGVPSSVFICYDLRFPEAMRAVAKDVKAIFVIANWPTERISHWSALLKARAIENQCFVVGLNRIGEDPNGLSYPGASAVFGPDGEKICEGTETQELVVCEFDLGEVDNIRRAFPFLDDIRS